MGTCDGEHRGERRAELLPWSRDAAAFPLGDTVVVCARSTETEYRVLDRGPCAGVGELRFRDALRAHLAEEFGRMTEMLEQENVARELVTNEQVVQRERVAR